MVRVIRKSVSMSFQNSEWDGFSISDPFNTPEAVVEVHVDGIPSLGSAVSVYIILLYNSSASYKYKKDKTC